MRIDYQIEGSFALITRLIDYAELCRRLRRIVGMPCTRGGEGVGVVKSVPPP
jgi:hypothetical protein